MLRALFGNDPLELRPPPIRVRPRTLLALGVVLGWATALIGCGLGVWVLQHLPAS